MRWMNTAPGFTLSFSWLLAVTMIMSIALEAPAGDSRWLQAHEPRTWTFPRDHGAHPEYQTEWWYYTGNLADAAGNRYGYQLTFFRIGVNQHADRKAHPWRIRDLYMAHVAITEEAGKTFRFGERISREGPGLAGARTDAMEVWIFNWSARMEETDILLDAHDAEVDLTLTLVPLKPLILHGERGLSRKGPSQGQASYYTSFTRLDTRGTIRAGPARQPVIVSGTSWFDHEFGSGQLSPDQQGWDWFSLHLSDGRDLMLYTMRGGEGEIGPFSSGTLIEADGTGRHLPCADFTLRILKHWESPQSGARYPGQWHILIPSAHIEILVNPLIPHQELITTRSTGITYWEGAIRGEGSSGSKAVTAEGYAELTGYAGSMGGIF